MKIVKCTEGRVEFPPPKETIISPHEETPSEEVLTILTEGELTTLISEEETVISSIFSFRLFCSNDINYIFIGVILSHYRIFWFSIYLWHIYTIFHITPIWRVGDLGVIVRMDKQGRIVIPARIRKRFSSRLFLAELIGDELRLKPINPVKLTELFDTIEVCIEDFTDIEKLRKRASR